MRIHIKRSYNVADNNSEDSIQKSDEIEIHIPELDKRGQPIVEEEFQDYSSIEGAYRELGRREH